MSDLFSAAMEQAGEGRPLADRMRPRRLDEYIGQQHLLGEGKPLRESILSGRPHSLVLWGPPGTGKTTLARIIAAHCEAEFVSLSAVLAGVKDIRAAVDAAAQRKAMHGQATLLFIDEVHRFNKGQQDAFLPHIEDGTVIFVGATTENPSFELNNALLSRARTYVLKSLESPQIVVMLQQALDDGDRGLGELRLTLEDGLIEAIAEAADGDGRRALNLLEIAADLAEPRGDGRFLARDAVADILAGGGRRFDKGGEAFYDQISALHKSVRGSDPDAALYWLCRMLDGGCDPLYIARRVIRMAPEDIGLAEPRALQLCLAAWDTLERLGSPEGELALAQAVVYLAACPKSNAVYTAYKACMAEVRESGSAEVPMHLRNAPTKLMKELGYGREYRYAHDEPHGYAAGETYLPDELVGSCWYRPLERGAEKKIADRLAWLRSLDEGASG